MNYLRITAFGALIVLLAAFVACGGGSSAPSSTTSAGSLASSITLGDAAADNIVSFEITINSITLKGPSGSKTVLSSPRRLEMTHLSATVEPLSIGNLSQGDGFTSADIAWSSPEVTFLNAAGVPVEVQSSASGTVPVSLSLTVSQAAVLNFDLDVSKSVTVDPNAGTATFASSPAFSFTSARGMGEAEREAETGEIEDMQGSVVSASSTSVTITGIDKPFVVNATTQLEGITSTSQLVAGQIIRIEGTTQSDGTLLAKEIEAESADGNGAEAEGLVTSKGATSFTMIVHDSSGASMSSSDLGKTVSVDASRANFSIGKTKINTGSFGFASLADLHPGQRVEADSDTPKSAGAGSVSDDGSFSGAKKIKLQQQALTGTVSNVAGGGTTFTLTVPADSAFAKLAGTNIIQVVNNGAQMKNGATVSANVTLRVRGLLFADVAGTTYTLVAGRITTP